MLNLTIALEACGATFNDLIKLNINLLQGQDAREGFEASKQFMGTISNPPIVTVLFVAGFGHPDYLVEIDAIAFVPEK